MQHKHISLIAALSFVLMVSQHLVAQDEDGQLKKLFERLREEQPTEWSYSELTEKADVIVIAKLKSKSTVKRVEEIAGNFASESTSLIKNRLTVLADLKGDVNDVIDVYTLKWKPDSLVLINFDFAEFRTKQLMPVTVPVVINGEITGYGQILEGEQTCTIEPEYLLFLKKSDNKKYTLITGHRYSGKSVRRLK